MGDDAGRDVETLRRTDSPAATCMGAARGPDNRHQRAIIAVIQRHIAQLCGIAPARNLTHRQQIIAVAHPHIHAVAAIHRQRRVTDLLPLIERRAGPRHNPVVERERQQCHAKGREDQRRQHLMRRQTTRLHRYHFAVGVQLAQCDDGAKQHRKGEEVGDDLRRTQADIAPNFAIAIAGIRKDAPRFPEQVERLENQHQPREHDGRPHQEGAREIKRHGG